MKTIYSMTKGYIHLDTYHKTHASHPLRTAVLSSLVLAAIISTLAGLASKYIPFNPELIKNSRVQVIGY